MANPESKKLAVDVIARVDKLEKEMKKAGRVANDNFKKIETRGERFQRKMGAVGKTAFSSFALQATAALAPLALFRKALNDISETSAMAKVADKVGVGTEALQRLRYGFELTGVAANTTDQALQRFSRRVAEAASGSGELLPILKANNIQLRDSNGNMRSQVDILRDYANLIKNAGSSQEQLLLAFKAFDSEGAAFVNGLRDGADGLDTLMRKADDAGGVIDDELVRKSEELDDKFAALWRNFDTNSTTAILSTVSALDGLEDKLTEIGNSSIWTKIGEAMGLDMDQRFNVVPGQGIVPAGEGTSARPDDGSTEPPVRPRKPTVIPPSGGSGSNSRNAAADAAAREAEAVLKVIERLKEERDLIGATDLEREKANALRHAGSAATADQRAEIEMLVEAIYREREANEARTEAIREARDAARDFAGTLVDGLVAGEKASDVLESALKRLASQMLNSGLDRLFNIGGTGGGALLGATFSLNIRSAA